MNSDPSPTGSTPGPASSPPHRSSNLKGRWKRAASPGVPPPRPSAAAASCGEVADISAVRETLSGEHAKGYVQPERQAEPVPPAPAVTTPAPREPIARERPAPPSPPPPRERPAPPPPRPASESRGGQREQYVGLKPDPANDPAPRRLRTENAQPLPVQEYAPSAFARAPDKAAPARSSRENNRDGHRENHRDRDRRESSRESPSSKTPRPHAVIPAHPSRAKEAKEPAKPKSGGIVGFIKRMFSGDRPVDDAGEEIREDRGERHADGDRERDRGGSDRSERRHRHGHHQHSRGGRDRSGRSERS